MAGEVSSCAFRDWYPSKGCSFPRVWDASYVLRRLMGIADLEYKFTAFPEYDPKSISITQSVSSKLGTKYRRNRPQPLEQRWRMKLLYARTRTLAELRKWTLRSLRVFKQSQRHAKYGLSFGWWVPHSFYLSGLCQLQIPFFSNMWIFKRLTGNRQRLCKQR